MSKPRIIAMIPARIGSERLKYKNLRLLNGKPVIGYAVEAAIDSGVFDRIVINSDGEVFGEIAERYGVEFYHRDADLANSQARSDDVVADFMSRYDGDVLAWVNPIAPLQPAAEVAEVINHFVDEELDSLITVKNEQVHCLYDGAPINFSVEGLFAKTQDLVPVQSMVYSMMVWRYTTFLDHYGQHGYALLTGRVGYYPVSKDSTIILKHEEDLRMAEAVVRTRAADEPPAYDPIVKALIDR